MANDAAKAHRILHVKIRTPSPDAAKLVASMMKNAAPMYQAFGDVRIRLLRNVDDNAQFLQVIEYQADQTIEQNRQKLASDPITQNIVQAWRSLFPGAIEVDVYEDVTDNA
jgi:uncharacterized protein Yka (UPF0111/DUF47 family)